MYLSAVVAAAGSGVRLKSKTPKPLVKLGSQPVIIYSLETLSKHPLIKEIIVVVNSLNREGITAAISKYGIKKIKELVSGGKRRQDSVYNGIKATSKKCDLILIHDAGRPFIKEEDVSAVVKKAQKSMAAILAVPVKGTIKQVTRSKGQKVTREIYVKKTLDRKLLWEIQTPQVFAKGLIVRAYKKFNRLNVTDDAALVEKLKSKIAIVHGSYNNIKITTPDDLGIAKILSCSHCERPKGAKQSRF